ncbi:MAG: hypothetical protein ACE5JR_08510 [Gemmatimonadota bacterium]
MIKRPLRFGFLLTFLLTTIAAGETGPFAVFQDVAQHTTEYLAHAAEHASETSDVPLQHDAGDPDHQSCGLHVCFHVSLPPPLEIVVRPFVDRLVDATPGATFVSKLIPQSLDRPPKLLS